MFKSGKVALIGRPNAGKSTLVNSLVGTKVAVTSPKPQTTQFPIYAVYEDSRGQVIFVDTPGIFAKNKDRAMKGINLEAEKELKEGVDVVVYLIDRSRERGMEENRVLGLLRKINAPKILVINKIDKREPDFSAHYRFLEEEFDQVIELSALKHTNVNILLDAVFEYLPEGEKFVEKSDLPVPVLNLNSYQYVEEMIKEKVFLRLRRELPYKVRVVVDEIKERDKNLTYIKARLVTTSEHYRKMIIGAGGVKIKEIGSMSRRELESATGRKIYLDLTVESE